MSVILHWLFQKKKEKKERRRSLESVSVDESLPISSGPLNLVKVLLNDVKQHSLEREMKTLSVIQKQDDKGRRQVTGSHKREGRPDMEL